MHGGVASKQGVAARKIVPTLWIWGNGPTNLMNSTININGIQSKPVQLGSSMNWSLIKVGEYHALAIKSGGTLWAWGTNPSGVLGIENTQVRSSPVQVGSDNWTTVDTNRSHSMGIKSVGSLWAWGSNISGQLGQGNLTVRSSPTQVGTATDWSSVSAGTSQTMAIKTTGTLWAWGGNAYGRLGLGDATNRSSPVQVGTDTNWQSVSSGNNHTAAIKTTGSLWTFGNGLNGRLGHGNTTTRSSPVQVGAATDWSFVKASPSGTFAIKTGGTLWAWGFNTDGQLGLGDVTARSSPVQVGTDTNWASVNHSTPVNPGQGTITTAIKTTGTLWSWGLNTNGRLGIGNSPTRCEFPVQVGTDTNWASVSAGSTTTTMAVKTDGTLWGWGTGANGVLGGGNTTNRSSPVQIHTSTNWLTVSVGGGHSLAIRTGGGSLWAWGLNTIGQLGQGNTTVRSSPVQVGTDTDWSSVSAGNLHSMAIKTTGTLWAWGGNTYGKLGLGDTTNRSSPVQVGTDTNWQSVSSGGEQTMAIKTNGTLWAWGLLLQTKGGIFSSPVQIGTDTDWSKVVVSSNSTYYYDFALAIKTDGTLWAWGANNSGQLGLGDINDRISPTQVGTDTNWASLNVGTWSSFAIKTTGSLWAWGLNATGQLGLGDIADRSSPVQVGTDTDWSSVSSRGFSTSTIGHTLALKTNGTLWSWGSRTSGQGGVSIIASISSPIQIGTATNWKVSSSGALNLMGVKIFTTQNPTT